MKIVDIQWRNYRLPLVKGFSTAHGMMTMREGVIVLVTTESGITGIGEIAPLPAFSAESLADATLHLSEMAACLYGRTLHAALNLLLAEGRKGTKAASTLCGLEMALLDAIGKTEERQVCALLAPPGFAPRTEIAVNAVIGAKAKEAAAAAALAARDKGFRCIKLKVGLGGGACVAEEIERIAAVRDAIGPATRLRLDANEAWKLDEAIAVLSQCVPYNIQYIEQPLQARDLVGMRALRQAVSIPLAADEALDSLESAHLVLDSEAADVLVIKPQLAGGLRAAQQIIEATSEQGVRCVITGVFEAGVGIAAALHLAAASPAVTFECGLATLPLLDDDLLIDDLAVRDGFLAVPSGAGLGIVLDWDALNRYGFV